MKKYAARFHILTRCLEKIIHSALGYLLLSVSLTGSSCNKCISCEQARLCFCLRKLLTELTQVSLPEGWPVH